MLRPRHQGFGVPFRFCILSKLICSTAFTSQVSITFLKGGNNYIWVVFLFAIVSKINCQSSKNELVSKFCSKPGNEINLKVFNVNIWGLSYFDDLPSDSEKFDVDSARQSLTAVSDFTSFYSSVMTILEFNSEAGEIL